MFQVKIAPTELVSSCHMASLFLDIFRVFEDFDFYSFY